MKDPQTWLEETRIVAIIRGVTGEAVDRTVEALGAGGVKLVEVTMNTEGALESIRRCSRQFSGVISIGAGTVLDLQMAEQAVEAGARYLISPNLDEEVIQFGLKQGVAVWPGVMTPTEIVRAWRAGAKAVKLFPTGSLGLSYIKEIRAPLSHIPLMATGGVTLDNITEFLQAGVTAVGLGSHLVHKGHIEAGRYGEVQHLAEQFTRKVREFQGVESAR